MLEEDVMKIVIQVNGKLRSEIEVQPDLVEEEIKKIALEDENVKNMSQI